MKGDEFLERPLTEAEIELLDDFLISDAAPEEAMDVSMNTRSSEFDIATSALADNGWCVVSNFLSQTQTQALSTECMAMHDAQLLTPARVGADHAATLLRGDSTRWFLPEALSTPQQAFANRIEALRIALNRDLFLGLVDSESHYAVYRPGAGYARHLDCLRNNDTRVISAVFYLNEAWQDAEGGALRLYFADQSYHDVFPRAGTLLLFLSAQFEHEVLPATRDRMSIACWMRQRVYAEARAQLAPGRLRVST
ncbi:2OG-Fe(II) oxygenase [Paraburkholderia sp. BL10I2N1]|uniref:2OG-Fe(II) oxygenase n=1 Tax=Paraburkholderia sp. BL10I2N1 TaxID=1938796 RepID=UPI0010CFD54A|nr:2OG-Fe(II) oxygenase [Paraburkholderia sp. BL10I2N1]TDN63183.1 SM-20-related protein [Paraburkholderia sp. BL10I2N1]